MFTCLSRDGGFHRFLTFLHPMAQTAAHHSRSHDPAGVRPAVCDFGAQAKALRQAKTLRQAQALRLAQTLLAGDCAASSATVPRPSPRSRGSFSAGLGWTRLDSTGVERLPLAAADRLVGRTRRDRERHPRALRAEATNYPQARFGEGLRSCSHSGIFGGVLKSRHCTRRDERPYHSPKC